MALTGSDFWQPERGSVMVTAVGTVCFFCQDPIEQDPALVWGGASGEVFMHLPCAADFMIRVASDLHTWQRKSGHRFRTGPSIVE